MKANAFMGEPALSVDVWKRSDHLKYQNKRADYILERSREEPVSEAMVSVFKAHQ